MIKRSKEKKEKMIADTFAIVFGNLKSRRLRSFLTLLGIIIGVSSIILLYSFAQSMEDLAGEQFDKLGSNRIIITPKGINPGTGGIAGAFGLVEDDAHYLETLPGVDYSNAMLAINQPVSFHREEKVLSLTSVSTHNALRFFKSFDWGMIEGRIFNDNEKGNVVVIGYKIATDVFDKRIHTKNTLVIGGKPFKVVGILEEKGNREDDYRIVIPLEAAREISGIKEGVTGIVLTVVDGYDLEKLAEVVKRKLKRKKDAENFEVTTPAQLKEQSKRVLGVIKQVIVAIAMISLIVGGLGIMNSMYTAVLERTREIGVMKAIGAKNSDVLQLFLVESSFMGLLGGLIGLLISLVLISLANIALQYQDVFSLTVTVKPLVIVGALGFSLLVGLLSGLYPAWKAATLQPVDALRYE